MSQINLHKIIRQQQEQLAAMQVQIQALLVVQGGTGAGGEARGSNMGSHMEVAKPAIFNGEAGKVGGFIMACMLWNALDMKNFYFLFLLFPDFIRILFSFSFSFLLDDEEAHDKEVT